MFVQPQKETFIIPEFRKHFLKISWELLDNDYLLPFTKKIKKFAEKGTFYFIFSETNNNFEKLRVAQHRAFFYADLQKVVVVQNELYKK